MAIGTVISLIGAIGGIVTGMAQASAMRRQANLQEKSIRTQRTQAANAERRSRMKLLREQKIKAAQVRSVAQGAGASETSALQGGLSSLSSQRGSKEGFSRMQSGLSDQISMFQGQAVQAGADASRWGAIGGMFGAIGGLNFGGGGNTQARVPNLLQQG
jgi:hypothetical protein